MRTAERQDGRLSRALATGKSEGCGAGAPERLRNPGAGPDGPAVVLPAIHDPVVVLPADCWIRPAAPNATAALSGRQSRCCDDQRGLHTLGSPGRQTGNHSQCSAILPTYSRFRDQAYRPHG